MFNKCSSLTAMPPMPTATLMFDSCFYQMFAECTSLTAVTSLPGTTLAKNCYYRFFWHDTGITAVPPDFLPAPPGLRVIPASPTGGTLKISCRALNSLIYSTFLKTNRRILPICFQHLVEYQQDSCQAGVRGISLPKKSYLCTNRSL